MSNFDKAMGYIKQLREVPTHMIDQSVGYARYTDPCCVGAHLAIIIGCERREGDDYRYGAHTWAKWMGGNMAHAVVMLRQAGAGDRPLSAEPWPISHQAVCDNLMTVETLPSLKGEVFQGENFDWMNLSGSDFTGACLQNSRMSFANFNECDFTDADMRGITAEETSFDDAIFVNTKLGKSNLVNSYWRGAKIINVNFHDCHMKGIQLTDAVIQNPVFKDTTFK